MKPWIRTARAERGVALPLALFALVMLSGLLLAFLSMSGMEPQISANLGDVTRARYVADAGIEWAFDQMVTNVNWNGVLIGPDNASNTSDDGLLVNNQTLPAPLNNAVFGTFTVRVRNDNQNGDLALTGVAIDGGGATNDTNGAVIVTASGTYNGVTRTIQVVLRRLALPPFPGAYSMPGVQADLRFDSTRFLIDGNDYICTADCSDPDFNKRTYDKKPDQKNRRYGIATSTTANGGPQNLPGIQQNIPGNTTTYEMRAESRLIGDNSKLSNVIGKDQTNPSQSTSGLNTVAGDAGVNPVVMQDFLNQLAQFSGTTVFQSTMACPMVMNSGGGNATNAVNLSNGCGVNQTLSLGSRDNPRLVYFRGELDPTSSFTSLRTAGNIQGAGILVIEDGDWRPQGQFYWDGVVIVTGRYVSTIFDSGSANVKIYGSTVSNETVWDEGGGGNQSTYWDGYFNNGRAEMYNSQEALDLVQRKLLFRMSTWREL